MKLDKKEILTIASIALIVYSIKAILIAFTMEGGFRFAIMAIGFIAMAAQAYILATELSPVPLNYIYQTIKNIIKHPFLLEKRKEYNQTMKAMDVDHYHGTVFIDPPDGSCEVWAIVAWEQDDSSFPTNKFFVTIDPYKNEVIHAQIGAKIKNPDEHTLESLVAYSQNRYKHEAQGDALTRRGGGDE